MLRAFFILLFISLTYTQEGEIVNVQAAQRTDGSGIVDISYTLLPDDTFPSFEVSAYQLLQRPTFFYELNDDGYYDIFIDTGGFNIYQIIFGLSCWNQDVTSGNNSFIPEGSILGEFYVDYYAQQLPDYIYIEIGEYIPSNTYGLLLTVTNDVGVDFMSCGFNEDLSSMDVNIGQGTNSEDLTPLFLPTGSEEVRDTEYLINLSGQGIGENIFPGTYELTWQLPDNYYNPEMIVRIKAEGFIVDSELPFDMVTIPSGSYFNLSNEESFIDYSYEIMKYEITNQQFVEWALFNEDLVSYYTIDYAFENISFDGNTLEITPGTANYPLAYAGSEMNAAFSALSGFLDYYGLRFPNQDEWIYAARGSNNSYFPWVSTSDTSCWLEDTGDAGGWYCDMSCFNSSFCIDGEFPYNMDAELYTGGLYPNASPFGVYDMIGNVQEIVFNQFNLNGDYDIMGGSFGLIDSYASSCNESSWDTLVGFNPCPGADLEWYEAPCGEPNFHLSCSASYPNTVAKTGFRFVRTITE